MDPAEQRQHGPDQLLLGDRFVGAVVLVERLKPLRRGTGKRGEGLRLLGGRPPFGGMADAVGEEVLGEQLAGHGGLLSLSLHGRCRTCAA